MGTRKVLPGTSVMVALNNKAGAVTSVALHVLSHVAGAVVFAPCKCLATWQLQLASTAP